MRAPGRRPYVRTFVDPETPGPFRPMEGLYAFRFEADGDQYQDGTFKVRFGDVSLCDHDGRPGQSLTVPDSPLWNRASRVRRAEGELLAEGATGEIIEEGDSSPGLRRIRSQATVVRSARFSRSVNGGGASLRICRNCILSRKTRSGSDATDAGLAVCG